MKSFRIVSLSLLSFSLLFNSCKKGKDDPLLSFHSRKARVAGDWKSTHYYYKNLQTDSIGQTVLYEFWGEGATYNYRFTLNGSGGFIGDGTFRMKWSFSKDGAYSREVSVDGDKDIMQGKWNFTNGIGEVKNKSQIALFEKSYTTYKGLVYGHEGNFVENTFDILELRNKKMHLHSDEIRTYPTGDVRKDEYEYTVILEQEQGKSK